MVGLLIGEIILLFYNNYFKGGNRLNEIKYLCWDIHKDIYVEREFRNLLKAARAFFTM